MFGKPSVTFIVAQMIPSRIDIPVHLDIDARSRPLIDLAAAGEDERRRPIKPILHQPKRSRRVLIVRIQKSQDSPACPRNSFVPGVIDAAIRLREHFQMRILFQATQAYRPSIRHR